MAPPSTTASPSTDSGTEYNPKEPRRNYCCVVTPVSSSAWRAQGVVPVAMEVVRLEAGTDRGHLGVGHFDASRVAAFIESACRLRPVRVRLAPIRLTTTSRLVSGCPAPVAGDRASQAVLDLVELGGARRKVADGEEDPGRRRPSGPVRSSRAGCGSCWNRRRRRRSAVAGPSGRRRIPSCSHQLRRAATAKAAVSWSTPTDTHPRSHADIEDPHTGSPCPSPGR